MRVARRLAFRAILIHSGGGVDATAGRAGHHRRGVSVAASRFLFTVLVVGGARGPCVRWGDTPAHGLAGLAVLAAILGHHRRAA
ncbi:MAG: hypothetical protein AUK49_12125 [Betaproteobacteria bacterium CG2_30_68_42]|nr:MAG: hypothetical protein AUK49_12125 [Betaproteobacteria bacterium CG2_30_68_42]PIX75803.1 MAG: hypothetical protein COZ38_03650 [Rhodocyclales bacterium CG_4_10_14_3_um_filter_68_10]